MKHIKQWLCALLAPVLAFCLLPLPAAGLFVPGA